MWRSVFLHEFIDHRITNFQALAGHATPASLTLAPTDDAVAGVNAVRIIPGAGFEYVLGTPLPQVIGFSCRVRLMYPRSQVSLLFPVVRLGADAELLLRPVVDSGFHPQGGTPSMARVRIGSSIKNLGNVELPAQNFVDFRFDWHTSGQARVLADGRLVAYAHSVSPGASFAVDRVAFGIPNAPSATRPLYHVARVFVRVLQRPDALAHLSKLLPKVKVQPDQKRCRQRVIANVLAMVDRLRQFMAKVHQTLSQTWTERAGPAEGPFKPDATRAHALATQAVAELVRMLRTNDFTAPERFLDPFTEFLRILRDARPTQFAALAAELGAMKVVPDECRGMFDAALKQNSDALAPMIDLMTEASNRARQLARRPPRRGAGEGGH